MTQAEGRIFTVLGKATVDVEGTRIEAWKEVPLPNGRVRRMTEVELPRSLP